MMLSTTVARPSGCFFVVVFALALLAGQASCFQATGMCVQLGQANFNFGHSPPDDYYWNIPWNVSYRWGYYSIGGKLMDFKYIFLDDLVYGHGYFIIGENPANPPDKRKKCPYATDTSQGFVVDPCPTDKVEIKTYAVEQDGKVMTGWLHVEVKLTDPTDEIVGIYLQMRDEWFNAIGEFVIDDKERCPPVTAGLVEPTQYQVLPCAAVGFREPKISYAVFMGKADDYTNSTYLKMKGYLPKEDLKSGIRFTWRFSEYWCNRHLRFRPEVTILPKSSIKDGRNVRYPKKTWRRVADYWLRPKWFGTADIKLPHTKLTCNKEVIDYQTGEMLKTGDGKLVAPWLNETAIEYLIENDIFHTGNLYSEGGRLTLKSCQFDTWKHFNTRGDPARNPQSLVPTFSGRCTHHFKKDPSHNALQGCNLNTTAEEFEGLPQMETYSDYVNALFVNRTKLCASTCEPPRTEADLEQVKGYKDRTDIRQDVTTETMKNIESRILTRRSVLWQAFKYHAILTSIWTLFLAPVNIFVARYYKETFMTHSCSGIQVWYWVHLGCVLVAICLFGSSYASMYQNIQVWGNIVDDNADAHRIIGWSAVSLFLMLAVFGGLRGGREISQMKVRLFLMTAHVVSGFVQYFLNLVAIIVSTWVPGSPSLPVCEEDGMLAPHSSVLIITLVWIVVDVAFHVGLTFLQFVTDRKQGIRRGWCCPFIPILPSNSDQDMKGSAVRKILLLTYVAVAFIFTLTTCGIIIATPDPNCSNYTTTCQEQHPDYIYGCSALTIRFAKKDKAILDAAAS